MEIPGLSNCQVVNTVGAASGHSLGSPEQSQSQSARVKLSAHTSHHNLPSVNREEIYSVLK